MESYIPVSLSMLSLAFFVYMVCRSPGSRTADRRAPPPPDELKLRSEQALRERIERQEVLRNRAGVAVSLHELSVMLFEQHRCEEAEQTLRRALAAAELRFGGRSGEALYYRDQLVDLLQATGQLHEAAVEAERALDIAAAADQAPGSLARRCLSLGKTFLEQGLLLKAEGLLRRAGEVPSARPDAGGDAPSPPGAPADSPPLDLPSRRQRLQLLAGCLIGQGRLGEAEGLLNEVLALTEKHCGADHPELAARLRDRADLYRVQGRHDEAAADLRRALAILAGTGGPRRLEVVQLHERIADVLRDAARFRDAEAPLREALALKEGIFGEQHAVAAEAVGSLGELYQLSGRYDEAEPLLRRALVQREAALGTDHPFLTPHLARLARLLQEQGRYHEAQALQRRVLALREQVLGPDHPGLVATLDELIDTQRRGGDLAQMEQWIERTLRIRQKCLGLDHPEHGFRLAGLAMMRGALGQARESELLYLQALAVLEKAYGEQHLALLPVLMALGAHCFQHEDYARAEALLRRGLGIAEPSLGGGHLNTIQCREALAAVLDKLGRTSDAMEERRRAAVARTPEPTAARAEPKLLN